MPSVTRSPSVVQSSGSNPILPNWVNGSNAYASDDVYATCNSAGGGGTTDALILRGFGFSISEEATIEGFQLDVECKDDAGTPLNCVLSSRLYNSGSSVSGLKSLGSWSHTVDTVLTLGGSSDLWSWTPSIGLINTASFGVSINMACGAPARNFSLDHVELTIYYSLPVKPFRLVSSGPRKDIARSVERDLSQPAQKKLFIVKAKPNDAD